MIEKPKPPRNQRVIDMGLLGEVYIPQDYTDEQADAMLKRYRTMFNCCATIFTIVLIGSMIALMFGEIINANIK